MNKYTIKKLLGLPFFKVTGIILINEKEIRIEVRPYRNRLAVCSGCGKKHSNIHSYDEVVVEDRKICGRRTYLHVFKRRCRCPVDNSIRTEQIDWLKKWSRVTNRFAEEVGRLTAITTNEEAGWFLGLDDESVYRIDKEMLEEKFQKNLVPPPAAMNISVDEVSYRKYHRYLTNVVDVDRKDVIWNEKGRKAEVLDRYYIGIGKQACEKIESVALDGARTYISSTNKYAVNATIVCDKFHIIQKLNWAVDMTRKLELHKARKEDNNELIELINCRQRFILFKNKSNRTESQANYLKRLCEINEPIYKAMLLKESFLEIYECQTPQEAQSFLERWIEQAISSSVESFRIIADSFLDKKQYIINWFKKRISSAISEGINNKIKRLKRMAYGYKDIEYFRLKIHQHCGLLNPRKYATF